MMFVSTERAAPAPIRRDAVDDEACTEESVRLPDGRRLGFREYGPSTGVPILLFHGLPGSRLQCRPEFAVDNLRLLMLERPGFGVSDPRPHRTLTDWADDVAAFAGQIGLDRFAICGWSGGGPFALACAAAMPERVTAVAVVGSLAPLDDDSLLCDMLPGYRQLFLCAKHTPYALPLPVGLYGLISCYLPRWRLRALADELCEDDRKLLLEPQRYEQMLADLHESLRQGFDAVRHELQLLSQPWGFDLDAIRAPVSVIHGDQDRIVPAAMGRRLAAHIPGSRLTIRANEGHFLLFRHHRAILRKLERQGRRPARCRRISQVHSTRGPILNAPQRRSRQGQGARASRIRRQRAGCAQVLMR